MSIILSIIIRVRMTYMKINYINFIEKTLNNASKIANENFGQVKNVSVKTGDNNQVLTQTDLAVGDYIVKEIKNAFCHNIIDEEAGIIDNKSVLTAIKYFKPSNPPCLTSHFGLFIKSKRI